MESETHHEKIKAEMNIKQISAEISHMKKERDRMNKLLNDGNFSGSVKGMRKAIEDMDYAIEQFEKAKQNKQIKQK